MTEQQINILMERLELAKCRMQEIADSLEDTPWHRYFVTQFKWGIYMLDLYEKIWGKEGRRTDYFSQTDLQELREVNHYLYQDILPEQYDNSYTNPDYAVSVLGEYGQILCVVAAELRSIISACYEGRLEELLIPLELLLEIHGCFQEEMPAPETLREILYWYVSDYLEVSMGRRVREQVDPEVRGLTAIAMDSDLGDIRYLYAYGEYVTENEEKMARYLQSLPQQDIQLIAGTFAEGYRLGFLLGRKDLSKKKTVNVRYHLGFERIIRAALCEFQKMGLTPTIYRQASGMLDGKGINRVGVYGARANAQFDYDHKEDMGLVLDKKMTSRKLEVLKNAYEEWKQLAGVHAGPAVMETFGEQDFVPVNKESAVHYTEKQHQLAVEYAQGAGSIVNTYIKGEERSFTIIAFPVPDIGENFEQIFQETIAINTLDYNLYRDMQQRMIDVLDQGQYVRVKGMGENKTDLKIMLHKLDDPICQTNFENCVADVNIPVGEVFTSPVLKGTEGILHVTKVFLNELRYDQLRLRFQDGMITEYECQNFETEQENQKFLKDNLLFHHNTLPLGEFAIGTNTRAYVMAEKLGIGDKLPILIAEKMGPHFAVGDTCYSHAEDTAVYNPDGKEIIARDNECSIRRRENPGEAYFNCHTDITIPYRELGEVSIVKEDGQSISILEKGRFVLPGLETLNEPFAALTKNRLA